MKRLLTIPYCLLLLSFLVAGIAASGAVGPGIRDSIMTAASPAAHIAGFEEGSAPAIITVGFGILVIYAMYRYWADQDVTE
jgi:hypothetical protein